MQNDCSFQNIIINIYRFYPGYSAHDFYVIGSNLESHWLLIFLNQNSGFCQVNLCFLTQIFILQSLLMLLIMSKLFWYLCFVIWTLIKWANLTQKGHFSYELYFRSKINRYYKLDVLHWNYQIGCNKPTLNHIWSCLEWNIITGAPKRE